MAKYIADTQKIMVTANELLDYTKEISGLEMSLNMLRFGMFVNTTINNQFKKNLNEISKEIELEKDIMQALGKSLIDIATKYSSCDRKIQNKYDGNYEISSTVFDGSGSYGGNQGGPISSDQAKVKELYEIIKKYYPDMTEKEVLSYLDKLNSEGCGYVALINTIFASFEGREEEFEKTFGFPMYNEDGDFNFDKLLVDFYSATDNHNPSWFFNNDKISNWEDYDYDDDGMFWNYDKDKDMTGNGTSQDDQKYRLEMYLKDHGISGTVETNQNVTVDDFEKIIEEGKYVTISYRYGNLYNEDGTVGQYINGGHAMVVTGVTDDGKFIVSSWGEKYYIDPNEIISKDGNDTSMNFNIISYE